ncbi:MAG: NACHT domain-containing protein [Mesorhizobium sp.]|nr:MAG: NACHT domain-containing protein [Mesorhizobium sp.]
MLSDLIKEKNILETAGRLSLRSETAHAKIGEIEKFLTNERGKVQSVRVLLIDGPAGIGKTHFVEQIASLRAKEFVKTQNPLILHVKSRGRILTFIQDLMAFSLQSLRLQVTYDQIPILVRHGLVQLAIDGFDELGDPNGYETAWGQVRELVEDIEGEGTIILAGRETFIGRERLLKAVPRLDDDRHEVGVFSILPTTPSAAKNWLKHKVSSTRVDQASELGLFDEGSYALRPFFLSQIAELLSTDIDLESAPPLVSLTKLMVQREATKFPDNILELMGPTGVRSFVLEVLTEIARDMAESQVDSIDEDSLLWIAETAAGDNFDPESLRIIKNRVQAIAFLENDERRGRRRFAHSEFFNYFLGQSAIVAVSKGETPKFVRRNIFGPDFLLTFGLVANSADSAKMEKFAKAALDMISVPSELDRSDRNIAALLFTCLPFASSLGIKEIRDVNVDDAVVRGVSDFCEVSNSSFNQIDLRECDLTNVVFENVQVATVIANEITRLPPTFPDPGMIQIEIEGRQELLSGIEATKWINSHGRLLDSTDADKLVPERVRRHELYKILQKSCRAMLRQHWIRSDGDDHVTRLVRNELWDTIVELLKQNGLLEERRGKPASGPPSVFYHILHAREILQEVRVNEQVASLFSDLELKIRELGDD